MNLPSAEQAMALYARVPHRRRWAAVTLILLLIGAAYVFFIASPEVETLDELSTQVADAENQRAEKERFSRDFSRYEQELQVYKKRLEAAREVLPDDPDIPQFLSTLGSMAHDLEVTILRLEPRPEIPHDFFAEISLHVTVRGSFHQIATLIDQIGNQTRIITVTNVILQDPKSADQRVSIEGQFDIHMYRFLTDKQIAELSHKDKKP